MDVDSIILDGQTYKCEDSDLNKLNDLGKGVFGVVERVHHRPSNTVLAVKRVPVTVNSEKQKNLVRQLDKCLKSGKCLYLVQYYGALIREGDVWICMEVMDLSLDKFYKNIYKVKQSSIPEEVLGRIALSIVKGLGYLHSELHVVHKDVKPTNILLNKKGEVKVCDFGISGHLVDSVEKTRESGCKPYMAPERINPDLAQPGYEMLADVWSAGITMIEVATGLFPYKSWKSPYDQLKEVVRGDPPRLPADTFSRSFEDFIEKILTKGVVQRANCHQLLAHPFLQQYGNAEVNVSEFMKENYRCGQ